MKQLLRATPLLFVILLLAACGGRDKTGSDSDTVTVTDPFELPADTLAAPSLALDSAGVRTLAGVRVAGIGTDVAALPATFEGVYDRIDRERGPEADEYLFINGDDYLFTALDFGSGKIDMIMVNSPSVAASVAGNAAITLTSPFAEVLAIPGIHAEWGGLDDTGTWYWTAGGLWFSPDQQHLPQELSQKLFNEDTMPASSDFDPSVRTGYIGTGIPY